MSFESTMNIYARPGTKVRYRARGGYDWEKEHSAAAGFVVDQLYTVKRTVVGFSRTSVFFEEIPGGWNSCLFADVAPELAAAKPAGQGEAEALRKALHALRYAVNVRPSCQKGVMADCRCLECAMLNAYDALAAPLLAQVQPAEQVGEPSASRMEVDSWRRALIQWHEATLAELVENPRGLRQCLSNAARLLRDHPALASPAPQPVSADTARLDWLTEQLVDTIYMDDGRVIDVGGSKRPNDIRAAIDAARTPNAQEGRQPC